MPKISIISRYHILDPRAGSLPGGIHHHPHLHRRLIPQGAGAAAGPQTLFAALTLNIASGPRSSFGKVTHHAPKALCLEELLRTRPPAHPPPAPSRVIQREYRDGPQNQLPGNQLPGAPVERPNPRIPAPTKSHRNTSLPKHFTKPFQMKPKNYLATVAVQTNSGIRLKDAHYDAAN